MAWLDDDPVLHAEAKKLDVAAFSTENQHNKIWKLQSFFQFPLIKKPLEWCQALVISIFLHRKLKSIKTKMDLNLLEDLNSVISFLRELTQIKKTLTENLHFPLIKQLTLQLQDRTQKLKRELVQKSYQVQTSGQNLIISSEKQDRQNSHHQILSLIGTAYSKLAQPLPNPGKRVYGHLQPTLYLHTSCEQLIQLLSEKLCLKNLTNGQRIKICYQEFVLGEEQLVCGVSIKSTTLFKDYPLKNLSPLSFFQQQRTNIDPLIDELNGKYLKEQINTIFFRTTHSYHDFKIILHASQNTELLSLFTSLEEHNQIIIHHHDNNPKELNSFFTNKR